MAKRYFLISVFTDGNLYEICEEFNSFPSRKMIELIAEENKCELKSVVNIFEFKSKKDYMSFVSERTEDEDVEYVEPTEKIDYTKFMAVFNSNCGKIPKIKDMTETRKRRLNILINKFKKQTVVDVILGLKENKFLQGEIENETGRRVWVATIDWILNESNFVKILEGNYKDKEVKKTFTV